jgi:hypothetical protein
MPTRILRTFLAIIVMVLAGAVPQRAPHHFPTSADSAGMADIVLAETSASSPSLHTIAQHPSANQLNVTRPTLSEPLLLLLMGTLLIAVGTSIQRLTKTRRTTRTAVPRQT